MHHDLTRSLNFLERIQRYIVEIAGAIEVPLFVSHDLLEEVIATSFTLLLFQKKVISGRDLVVFIVLDIRYSLAEVAIWTNPRRVEAVLDLAEELLDNWHAILSNDDTFHFVWLYLIVPFVRTNIIHVKSLSRISVQYFPDKILGSF